MAMPDIGIAISTIGCLQKGMHLGFFSLPLLCIGSVSSFGLIFQNDANQFGIMCYMRID